MLVTSTINKANSLSEVSSASPMECRPASYGPISVMIFDSDSGMALPFKKSFSCALPPGHPGFWIIALHFDAFLSTEMGKMAG